MVCLRYSLQGMGQAHEPRQQPRNSPAPAAVFDHTHHGRQVAFPAQGDLIAQSIAVPRIVVSGSEIFCDLAEIGEPCSRLRGHLACDFLQMRIDVVMDQHLLSFLDRFDDSLPVPILFMADSSNRWDRVLAS